MTKKNLFLNQQFLFFEVTLGYFLLIFVHCLAKMTVILINVMMMLSNFSLQNKKVKMYHILSTNPQLPTLDDPGLTSVVRERDALKAENESLREEVKSRSSASHSTEEQLLFIRKVRLL